MRDIPVRVAGDECVVHVPERPDDLKPFGVWLKKQPWLAVDTETTGLDWASPDFRLRLLQFGNEREAWVLRYSVAPVGTMLRGMLWSSPLPWVLHNAPFDLLALGVRPADWRDTKILAHLVDPRSRVEGGIGHSLKQLSVALIDPAAADAEAELHARFRKVYKATTTTGWAVVDDDDEAYLRYAGLDVILTSRLYRLLDTKVKMAGMQELADFEHRVQRVTLNMMERGIPLDQDYTRGLSRSLLADSDRARRNASLYGCDNVDSPIQVANALVAAGWKPTKHTPTGQPTVDAEVLQGLADAGNKLAAEVLAARRANKWKSTYADAMLAGIGTDGRIHPTINSLQARTGRMSISGPPLQQLPAGDWLIRRCLVAPEGQVIGAVDYQQIEMRILAAFADVPKMRAAISAGESIHDFTAKMLYGPGYTRTQYRLAKNAGFCKVYGGGAKTLASTAGCDMATAVATAKAYDEAFPEIKSYAGRLSAGVSLTGGAVTSPAGRVMPVDPGRSYAATNYMIQSTARDVLAQALLDLDAAGLGPYLLLPVHDEVVFSAPSDTADDIAAVIAETMTVPDFYGVPLDVDANVYGPSWGHGYGAPT